MAHTVRDKTKLINRVRRIRGQVDAIEKALAHEHECADVLQRLAACHGAMKSLLAELLEGHVRFHLRNPDINPKSEESKAAQELIDVLRTYLR